MTRSLAVLFAAPLCVATLAAQGTYYVDGALGLDAPGRGAAPNLPWKTIGYAAANAAGTTASPSTIQVVGGQTYASGTNGETFPVTLSPIARLLGVAVNGSLPVLAPSAGATALLFNPSVDNSNGATAHRRIIVQGGAIGLDVGSTFGVNHAATLEDCEFRGQTSAGVLTNSRGGATSILLRNCLLDGLGGPSGSAVRTNLYGPAPGHSLTIEGCTIRNWYYGVSTGSTGTPYWSCTSVVRDTTVANCSIGLGLGSPQLYGPPNSANVTTTTLSGVQVTDCNLGITMVAAPAQYASFTASASNVAVMRCTTGINLGCAGGTSNGLQSNWNQTTIAQCATGLRLGISTSVTMAHTFERSDFLSNTQGIDCLSMLGDFELTLRRCRVLDGDKGIALSVNSLYTGRLRAEDCLVARQSTCAIQSANGAIQLARSTLADSTSGIVASYTTGSIAGSLFSGNGADLQLTNPPGMSFSVNASATDGAALPASLGVNLQFANVGLQRPNYKLAPTSPCIDRGSAATGLVDYEGDPRSIADLGADEHVASGSLRTYGLRSVGDVAASPSIGTTSTSARIGASYQIDLANAVAAGAAAPALAFLASGVRDTAHPLPVELGPIGLPGCQLLLDPLVLQTMPLTSPTGSLSTTFSVPSQSSLLGFTLCHQWLVGLPQLDGFVTSDALRVTIGQ